MFARVSIPVFCLVAILTAPMHASQERRMGGLGLEVFADNNFRGLSATYLNDTPDLGVSGMAGRISSLRVAPGEIWEVCTERFFRGRCQVVQGDENDLRRNGWNDVIMSVRRVRGGGVSGGRGGSQGLELYAGLRYSGQRIVVTEEVSNLRRVNFNDRASSLRVPRGEVWEICVNADFDDCRIVDGDVPDLGPVGLNREISSVRQRFDNWGRGGGRGQVGRGGNLYVQPRIEFFNQPSYRGNNTIVTNDMPSLGWSMDDGGSIRVQGGTWEICDGPKFSGRCVVISDDVPDTRRLNIRDRIWSVRQR
jgi:hypothetical protein